MRVSSAYQDLLLQLLRELVETQKQFDPKHALTVLGKSRGRPRSTGSGNGNAWTPGRSQLRPSEGGIGAQVRLRIRWS